MVGVGGGTRQARRDGPAQFSCYASVQLVEQFNSRFSNVRCGGEISRSLQRSGGKLN